MAAIQETFAVPVFNTTTPSSGGAAGATTFARPPSGNNAVNTPSGDPPSEIMSDVQWIVQAGS